MQEKVIHSLFNPLPSGEGWGGAWSTSFDIHTHVPSGPNSICSLPPLKAIEMSRSNLNQPYSIELHPWYASTSLLEEFLEACEICKDDERFVAIGECGLDTLAISDKNKSLDVSLETQKHCFKQSLLKAKELHKPAILHIVKAWELLYEIVDEVFPSLSNPSDPILIVHGFRKNVTFAKQLISRGFYLSLGEKYNPEVLSLIPSGKIFRETDRTIEE